jgi:hypothetical protein
MLPKKNSPQSPSIEDEQQFKNHDQHTSVPDIPTNSNELPKAKKTRYVWGATEILNSKDQPPEDIWDFCLTDPENPEESILELSRTDRSPPS